MNSVVWYIVVQCDVCSLVGYPPFSADRKDMTLPEQIVGGHYSMPDEHWKKVSADGTVTLRISLTVVSELLVIEYSLYINIRQCIACCSQRLSSKAAHREDGGANYAGQCA